MKTFKVTVDGQLYTVTVEEVSQQAEAGSQPNIQTPVVNPVQSAVNAPPAVKKEEIAQAPAAPAAAAASATISAPMPGQILDVMAKEGDAVAEGDVLLVLEAMKMENEITAPQAGTVAQVLVKQGDAVNSGDPLVTLN